MMSVRGNTGFALKVVKVVKPHESREASIVVKVVVKSRESRQSRSNIIVIAAHSIGTIILIVVNPPGEHHISLR